MNDLKQMTCEPCNSVTAGVSTAEKQLWGEQIPNWTLVQRDGVEQLERRFESRNYAACLDFVQQIGALAEQLNHHPQILLSWGEVVVRWWTHKIAGLHRNDYILAAKTDELWPF